MSDEEDSFAEENSDDDDYESPASFDDDVDIDEASTRKRKALEDERAELPKKPRSDDTLVPEKDVPADALTGVTVFSLPPVPAIPEQSHETPKAGVADVNLGSFEDRRAFVGAIRGQMKHFPELVAEATSKLLKELKKQNLWDLHVDELEKLFLQNEMDINSTTSFGNVDETLSVVGEVASTTAKWFGKEVKGLKAYLMKQQHARHAANRLLHQAELMGPAMPLNSPWVGLVGATIIGAMALATDIKKKKKKEKKEKKEKKQTKTQSS